jgi:hypothetical protein
MAARGLRRKLNQWLQCRNDFDEAMLPRRLECFWNNTYSWRAMGSRGSFSLRHDGRAMR